MRRIRKRLTLLVLTVLTIVTYSTSEVSAAEINMVVDGASVTFNESSGKPFIDNSNRTQVPLRLATEKFGCDVEWDNVNKIAVVSKAGIIVHVPIGQNYILKNGKALTNDTTAQIINGRTYLPIRIVLEAFGATVSWDAKTSSVVVISNSNNIPAESIPTPIVPEPEEEQASPNINAYQEEVLRHQSAISEIESNYSRLKRTFENNIKEIRNETTPYYGSSSDYTTERAALGKEISKVESELLMVRLDTSSSGNARRLTLEEELTNLQNELQTLEARYSAKIKISAWEEELNRLEDDYYDDLREENLLYQQNLQRLQ